ncbi:MAG TPA: hypothetical protein VFB16_12950 [Bauldia sp.]|nr:hypothetical protein [Bauldia sp.]
MNRIYENKGLIRRQNIYMAVLALVTLNGIWEIYAAFTAPEGNSSGMIFGILFLAGGAYGFYQTFIDGRDLIAALDHDTNADMLTATLWRPFQKLRLASPRTRVRNWRFWVKTGSASQRGYFFFADFPDYPRKLQMEIPRGLAIGDGLRRVAPQAAEDYEAAIGANRAG